MKNNMIKSIKYLFTALSFSVVLVSCELSAIDPMTNTIPDPHAYTLPRAVFMGTTIKISGSFIVISDSGSIYLRPVTDHSGAGDVKLKLSSDGITGWTLSLKIPASGQLTEGRYNLVVKRGAQTFFIKRTLAAMSVYANESFNRDPIPGDDILVSDCTLDTQGVLQYGVGDEIILKGIGFSTTDSLYFSTSNPSLRAAPYLVTEKNAHFIVPNGVAEGTVNLKFSNMPVYTVRTGYNPSYITLSGLKIAKSLTGITGITLPATPAVGGSDVIISGLGFASGDKVVVRVDGISETLNIDETAFPNLKFTLPTIYAGKTVQVLLSRIAAPLFSLGFITTDASKKNSLIANVSMPNNIPSGLQGKSLTFLINGSGFNAGDKIVLGTTVLTTTAITTSSILVTTAAANTAVGAYDIKLRRGTQPDELLGTVNVITAPRLFEYAEGGIVYWLDSKNPLKGLVCHVKDAIASSNITDDELKKVVFGVYSTSDGVVLPATSLNKAIGTGAANTLSIKNIQGVNSRAVTFCDTLKTIVDGNEYKNWYIPSIDELSEMYNVRTSINAAATVSGRGGESFNSQSSATQSSPGKLAISGYMSSSAITFSRIWACSFQNSQSPNCYLKTNYFRLRAVRSYDRTPISN